MSDDYRIVAWYTFGGKFIEYELQYKTRFLLFLHQWKSIWKTKNGDTIESWKKTFDVKGVERGIDNLPLTD